MQIQEGALRVAESSLRWKLDVSRWNSCCQYDLGVIWGLMIIRVQAHLYFDHQLMFSCQVSECSDNNVHAWLSHAQGTAHLIELWGSQMYTWPLAHKLYESFRSTAVSILFDRQGGWLSWPRKIIQSLQTRTSSFVNETKWLSDPWEGLSKDIEQKLYDLGAELCTILKYADRIKAMQDGHKITSNRLLVIGKCFKLEGRFEAWYDELTREIPTPHYWPQLSNMDNPADDVEHGKVFPVAFHFLSLKIAHIMLNHWALLIVLYSTVFLTHRALEGMRHAEPTWPEHPADDQCKLCAGAQQASGCHCGGQGRSPTTQRVSHRSPRNISLEHSRPWRITLRSPWNTSCPRTWACLAHG